MKLKNLSAVLVISALSATSSLGCIIDDGGPVIVVPADGTITVLATIRGSAHPAECDVVGATDIELAVYDAQGPFTTVLAPCYDLAVSAALPEGLYQGYVTLLDYSYYPASTTVTLDNLRVIRDTDLQVDVDFPSSSILP